MQKERFELLDIIKGVMIVFIIVTHFRFKYPEDYMKYGFFYWIDMAVPVFMIIFSYLSAISLEKNNITSIKQTWNLDYMLPKVLRFIIPYTIVMLFEIREFIFVYKYNFIEIIQFVVRGGQGPGAYYTPIMLQLIFFTPIVYLAVKKFDFFGVIICFLVTAFWELVQYSWGMDKVSYSLIFLRYISIISFGCFIAIGRVKLNRLVLFIMFASGIVWQSLLNYVPLNPIFMNYEWARVNYLSSLFVMPVMYVLIKCFVACDINFLLLQELGKATYNIFLIQMIFYGCGYADKIYRHVGDRWLQLLCCIAINLTVGYIFYRIENVITRRLIQKIKGKNQYKNFLQKLTEACNNMVSK